MQLSMSMRTELKTKLCVTQQFIQALSLLTRPSHEFLEAVTAELERNPALERVDQPEPSTEAMAEELTRDLLAARDAWRD